MITQLRPSCRDLEFRLGFTVQGSADADLPERLLAAVHVLRLDLDAPSPVLGGVTDDFANILRTSKEAG